MPAEQALGRFVHRVGIERRRNVPDPAGEQGGAGATVQDAIAIGAADRGEAGVPALRRRRRRTARPRGVASCGSSVRRGLSRPGWCRAARAARPAPMACTPASVRPATTADDRLAAVQLGGSGLQHLLDREPGCLALPADERRAVVFQQERPAAAPHPNPSDGPSRHRMSAQERARPPWRGDRPSCTRVSRSAPSPQATVSRSSSTVPGGPRPLPAQPPAPSASRRAAW